MTHFRPFVYNTSRVSEEEQWFEQLGGRVVYYHDAYEYNKKEILVSKKHDMHFYFYSAELIHPKESRMICKAVVSYSHTSKHSILQQLGVYR